MNSPRDVDENAVAAFEAAWIEGKPRSIAEALPKVAPPLRLGTLVELVLVEVEFSWKAAEVDREHEPKLIEWYVEQFPELNTNELLQVLLEEEYLIRRQHGDQPGYAEYQRRFPQTIQSLIFTQADEQDSEPMAAQGTSEIAVGTVIDRFQILELIGEGGMGRVFVAQQSRPVQRRVALKIIRRGMNSEQVISRFKAERQALAMMDHPNIARIIDGGTTADGQPYFAMELVTGVPITDFCDANRLSLNERLDLLMDVCSAVQHAHQKGIIHRDLKPSNILVAEYDGKRVPKVIDFGLAKALDSENLFANRTLETHVGQILGTLKYMSPEQADSGSKDIDTRTDIYALGVVMYELLTGSTPIDQDTIQQQGMLKWLELIRNYEPLRPSSKLSSSGDSVAASKLRRTDPGRLSSILRGDLDWVVMKALDKDRRRRYDTASSFADDIRRFLSHEPVGARPPSVAYRTNKFIRKNRGLVASLTAITLLLLGGIAGTSWYAVKASRLARSESVQKKIAQDSAKRSTEVLKIVSHSFRSTNPGEGADADMTAREVLHNAKETMESSELDELGKAELLETLSISFRGLGDFEAATATAEQELAIYKTSLGAQHPLTLNAMNSLANGLWSLGQYEKAIPLFESTLDQRKKILGEQHRDTISSMANLANGYEAVGKYPEAMTLRKQVLELSTAQFGESDRDTLQAMNNLAASHQRAGNVEEMLSLMGRLYQLAQESLGAEHVTTIAAQLNLATSYASVGRFEEGVALLETVIPASTKKLGADHPSTLAAMSTLAMCYYVSGRLELAAELSEKTVKLTSEKLGADHPDTLLAMRALSNSLAKSGKIEQALEISEKVVAVSEQQLGLDHPETLAAKLGLANLYAAGGQQEKALKLRRSNYDISMEKLGEDHPDTVKAMTNLAVSLADVGRFSEALPLAAKAWEIRKARFGEEHAFAKRTFDNFSQMMKHSLDQVEKSIAEDRPADAMQILATIKLHLPMFAPAEEFTARLESLETKLDEFQKD